MRGTVEVRVVVGREIGGGWGGAIGDNWGWGWGWGFGWGGNHAVVDLKWLELKVQRVV